MTFFSSLLRRLSLGLSLGEKILKTFLAFEEADNSNPYIFLDVPLRYPIRLMGSTTTILDEVKLFPDQDLKSGSITQGEFPLHLKNSSANEWSKFEYGLYLLNKNLSQLRWNCNLITTDLRPTLHNLEEILSLGKSSNTFRCQELLESMPVILTKTVPQTSNTERHHIIIKHGRATISGL